MALLQNLVLLIVLGSLLQVKGKPQQMDYSDNYIYDDDESANLEDEEYGGDEGTSDEERAIAVHPKFTLKGQTYTIDKGTTIRLPCYVDQFPENFVIMWARMRGGKPDYVSLGDNIIITPRERYSVELEHNGSTHNGSTLIISTAIEADAGQYICALGSNSQKEIKHTVIIRAPPKIQKTPKNGLIKARKGDSINFRCEAEGDPTPEVTWTRMGKRLPDGRHELKGDELRFDNVNRHHSGIYICTADNGYGESAREKIEVNVEYPPDVKAEEIFIHAAAGNSVELVCEVHAHPTPIIKWFKNSMELTDETAKLEKRGHKHILMLQSVDESDWGNYTCRAENRLGINKKILEVSGKAGFAEFRSNPKGMEPNSYVLEWDSKSTTPITAFQLKFRESGQHAWRVIEVEPIKERTRYSYAGKHALSGLKTATRYEATVAAKNDEGWSRDRPVFHFATFGAEPLRDANSAYSFSNIKGSHFLSTLFILSVAASWFISSSASWLL